MPRKKAPRDNTGAARQAKYRERKKSEGVVRVSLSLTHDEISRLKALSRPGEPLTKMVHRLLLGDTVSPPSATVDGLTAILAEWRGIVAALADNPNNKRIKTLYQLLSALLES